MTKQELLKLIYTSLFFPSGDIMYQETLWALQDIIQKEMKEEVQIGNMTWVCHGNSFPYIIDGKNWKEWVPKSVIDAYENEGDDILDTEGEE